MTKKLYWRHATLIFFSLGLLIHLFLGPVKTQDPLYHHFADSRGLFGIPNFGDVMSNLPFIFFGLLGVNYILNTNKTIEMKKSWMTFFVGIILVGPGSAYYHWAPDNLTLVWDRLPMTIGFMGLFVALLAEYIDARFEKVLIPAILLGFFSVIIWHFTGDLRLYIWVQAASVFCIPLIMLLYPSRYTGSSWLIGGFGAYALAKIVEYYDPQVFTLLGSSISGHTLKHLFASLAPLFMLQMLKKRQYLTKN
jgi:hypothetical protein